MSRKRSENVKQINVSAQYYFSFHLIISQINIHIEVLFYQLLMIVVIQ